MCNEKIEIHVAANAVRPRTDASVLSNHGVLQEGYQLCSARSAPGATAQPFNFAARRPPCPALVCAISPLDPQICGRSQRSVRWQVIGCCCGKKILGR